MAADHSLTGAQIRNTVVKAASRVVSRSDPERRVTQTDLEQAAIEEAHSGDGGRPIGFSARG